MNSQYISFVVVVLAQVLPMLGMEIGTAELTTTVSVFATVLAGVWGIISGWREGRHTLGGKSL